MPKKKIDAEIPFTVSESKESYIIFGEKDPHDMFLPIVFDVTDLQEFFDKIFPYKTIDVTVDTDSGKVVIKEK